MSLRAKVFTTVALAALLAACGQADTSNAKAPKKRDGKAWENGDPAYVAKGYKSGDEANWDQQLRTRAQNQNDYSRAK